MKKYISLLLCIALSLSLLLTGCGKPETVVGDWRSEIDLSAAMNQAITENDESMKEYFNFKDLTISLQVSFNEDGTCTATLDEESWNAFVESLGAQMKEQIVPYLQAQLEDSNMDLEALLDFLDTDLDSIIDMMLYELVSDEVTEEFNTEGYYKVEGDLLYFGEDPDDFDEDEATNFSFKDGKLILEAPTMFEDEEIAAYLFPMTLERVK